MATILLIDDDEALRKLISIQLKIIGHTVIEAKNGEKAVEQAGACQVDLIITDVNMPGRSGFETAAEIKQAFPSMRIVAMSGSIDEEELLERAHQLGIAQTLAKPFRLAALSSVVRCALRGVPHTTEEPVDHARV